MGVKAGDQHGTIDPAADDWKTLELGQLGTFLKGSGVKKDEAKSGNLPCIRYGEIYTHHNDIIRKFNSSISPTVAIAATKLRYGDLLFAGSGETKEDIGKCVAFVDNCEAYAGGDIVILRLKDANPTFMGYLSNSPYVSKQKASRAQGDAVVHISASSLSTIKISLPPLPEQQAIANALSDVDQLIASLDQLIAKKRDLKQAAMQQLLTGKTRLQGFGGAWETKRLGDVGQLYQPKTIGQSVFTTDGYPVYGANGIIGRYSKFNHSTRQITISCRGNCGTVNKTEPLAWITGNAMVVNLDANRQIDWDYAYQLLLSQDFSVLVTGSGQPQIVRGPLSDFLIALPIDLLEQKAIGEVLTDMDAELTELEKRRDKTVALKQGMMQELLTGRTRLV